MEDVVNLDVAVVFDVLHLLPVPVGLLESLDDEGGGGGTDGNLSKEKVFLEHLILSQ